ncbi:hypothetical protein NDU88_005067 [Pleurodeles waltl]|uniref:Uncharacterized protein n=1 Tax=Pleurodeles waltl TaxID=8319 RepID=A0AAV7MWQ6_PLEWA|nr:hypothetical protein NDU88_005067 [Pleurodeles waltl]
MRRDGEVSLWRMEETAMPGWSRLQRRRRDEHAHTLWTELCSSYTGEEHVELDTPITTDEIHMARNKTPGMDGLPVEYYATFAKQLTTPYLEVLGEAQMRG